MRSTHPFLFCACVTALASTALSSIAGCTASPPSGRPPMGGDAGPGAPPPGYDAGPGTVTPPPPPPDGCSTSAGMDYDMDGFPNGVDCNDCAPQINPGAFDESGNGIDEDCDGADSAGDVCDTGLPMAPGSPEEAARALGLCRMATGSSWGVVSARFTTADGSAAPPSSMQIGLLPSFGSSNAPREGASMLALSSGVARAPGQPGYTTECDYFEEFSPRSSFPPTFPQESSSCPGVRSGAVYDSVALEVTIRVPTNALGFSFSSSFFTYEYPEFICDEFNDFFAVLRQDAAGSWQNIVFDEDNNPVSVNNSLLRACAPGMAGGKVFDCPLGRGPLGGTGFGADSLCGTPGGGDPYGGGGGATSGQEAGGGTGWLRTVAPVTGGETITLRFAIWDSGDPDLDSTALVDAFRWELDPVMVTETVPDII
ncbi:MAG: putative metal-binding motif-containing protein [Sandaracinaceae bacterium]